jgi:hypothetical protein
MVPTMTNAKQTEVAGLLSTRLQGRPCPMCQGMKRTVLDRWSNVPIQSDISGGFVIPGELYITVLLRCETCGFLSQHGIDVIGAKS